MLKTHLITCLALAVLAIGCAKQESGGGGTSVPKTAQEPKPTESSAAKEGWKTVETTGFSLTVPSDWTPVDLASTDLDAIIDAAAKENEGVKMSAAQFKQVAAAGMVKLMVFGKVDPAGPFAENVNVVVLPAPQTPTTDQMVEAYKQQIAPLAVPGSSQSGGPHSLPAGDGVKMRSELAMTSGNAKSVASLAYMFPVKGQMYTVTFSCLPGRATEVEKLADEIMQSFKVK